MNTKKSAMEPEIARDISVFRKSGDDEAGRYRLRGVSLDFLQRLFGVPKENPMYDVYPMDYAKLAVLRRFAVPRYELVKRPLNLTRCEYFLEAEVEPESSRARDYVHYYGKTYPRKRRRPAVAAGETRKLAKK